jgi:hypothetical protein
MDDAVKECVTDTMKYAKATAARSRQFLRSDSHDGSLLVFQ